MHILYKQEFINYEQKEKEQLAKESKEVKEGEGENLNEMINKRLIEYFEDN